MVPGKDNKNCIVMSAAAKGRMTFRLVISGHDLQLFNLVSLAQNLALSIACYQMVWWTCDCCDIGKVFISGTHHRNECLQKMGTMTRKSKAILNNEAWKSQPDLCNHCRSGLRQNNDWQGQAEKWVLVVFKWRLTHQLKHFYSNLQKSITFDNL